MWSQISTHTPLARRDIAFWPDLLLVQFLLTRLSRGVTRSLSRPKLLDGFLLTRLSRGVTGNCHNNLSIHDISTHTPLARRDF